MKPELEQQKQIGAEAWTEAERTFLAAVKLKYAAGYIPTERQKHIGILVELFSLLYLRDKAGVCEEALRIQFDHDNLPLNLLYRVHRAGIEPATQ